MNTFKEKGLVWPLLVVLLLLSSVGTMGTFIYMANSDGGATVVEEYYDKALRWDSLSTARTELSKRKWRPSLRIEKQNSDQPLSQSNQGILVLLDSTGTKIGGLTGDVSFNQPHLNPGTGKTVLTSLPSDSTYRFEFEDIAPGLWDFTFVLRSTHAEVEFSLRKTL